MTKQKNQKKKSGKKKARKASTPRSNGIPTARVVSKVNPLRSIRMGHVKTTCSILDPFCIHARGAQRPDGGPPTIPYQVRGVYTVTSFLTNGATKVIFVPNPLFQVLENGSIAAGVWTMFTAAVDKCGNGFVNTNAKEVRITSYGVILRSAMTATTAKGMVILGVEPTPGPSLTYTQGTMQLQESQIITMAAGFEHAWFSKPMGPTAHNFRPIADYVNTKTDFDWTSLSVEVSGGDTTNNIPFLTAEIVMNVEFTCPSGGATTGIATLQKTPPAPSTHALNAAARAQASSSSFISGGIEKATNYLEKAATEALTSIASEGLALLGL